MTNANDTKDRGRYWAGLIYPEDSCPENWEELMKLSGLKILVSPLHDQDIANIATGELKKPHRHVIAMWANITTRKNAEYFFSKFNGPQKILRLESPLGMARYLIHLDDPDKAQYSPEDILAFNGADWYEIANPEDPAQISIAIAHLIEENNIRGYYDLLMYCHNHHPNLVRFVSQRTNFCRELIWSYWHTVSSTQSAMERNKDD